MKRLYCLILLAILFFTFSSCSLSEKKEASNEDNSLNSAEPGNLADGLLTANITMEKLEGESSLGQKYVFNGVKIQEDNGISAETARELFQAKIESNNLYQPVGISLELQFTDEIPKSITWYNQYYMDAKTLNFVYLRLREINTID